LEPLPQFALFAHTTPMEKPMAKQSENGIPRNSDHIEQIRDIIFGPQKREYDERFGQVFAEIKRDREDAVSRIEELRTQMQEKITAGLNALDLNLRQLATKVDTENANIQQLIEKTTRKLDNEIGALSQRLEENTASLRKDLNDTRAKLQSDIRSAKDDAARSLDAESTLLRETKVSRDVMSEMLHEMAMKLNGIEMLEELKKATTKEPGE
jgi:hypothetical protein